MRQGNTISARNPTDAIAPNGSSALTASTRPDASAPAQAHAALGASQRAARFQRPVTRTKNCTAARPLYQPQAVGLSDVFRSRRMGIMAFLGFSSGLPLL